MKFLKKNLAKIFPANFLFAGLLNNAGKDSFNDKINLFKSSIGYNNVDVNGAPAIVTNGLSYLLGLVGMLFLVLIIAGGIMWMTAEGNEEKVGKAKQLIINSLIGLVIVAIAFVISYSIFKLFYVQTMQ